MLTFNDSPADRGQIEGFFERHYDSLFKYAMYLAVGDAQQASDAVSESFTRIIEHYDRYRVFSDARLLSYMLTMLKNYLFDQQRKDKRLLCLDGLDQAPDETADFLEEEIQKIDEDILRRSIACLSVRDQAVIKLKYYDEADSEEIGCALGIKPDSVRGIASRALRRLKQIYLQKGADGHEK